LPHGGFGVFIGPRTTIGDDAIIFHNVTIGSARPGDIRIGSRAYIGAGAVLLGPLTIGDDVRIGAHAVVNEDIQDGATVVGQACRVIAPGHQSRGQRR
jgi:serine O-acetyltransferase